MSSKLSVAEVLENLESRAAFHREREAFHAGQEEQHRQERTRHAAELEKVLHNLETFRSASSSAVELVQQAHPAPGPTVPHLELPASGKLMVSRMIRAVVESQGDGEPFGASLVTAEVNRRFADRLRRPVDTRAASDVLRRMNNAGQIHLVRAGKAFSEALYAKGARGEEG
jgi:hypothetical protein